MNTIRRFRCYARGIVNRSSPIMGMGGEADGRWAAGGVRRYGRRGHLRPLI